MHPTLILGTAMWGWTIPEQRCFELLDAFYAAGFRQIDTATNYPINKNPRDFRRAETTLKSWADANGVEDLNIIVKIGSINNLRSPEHNLSKSFILMNLDDYRAKFGDNLDMLMVHWDNRDDADAIEQTLEALDEARQCGLQIGLSGVRHPEVYADLNRKFQLDFHIQFKHNLLKSDYERYSPFHGNERFIAYGINAGGIKLEAGAYHADSSLRARGGDTSEMHPVVAPLRDIIAVANAEEKRPKIASMNHCGMIFAYHSPDVAGILIGPSKPGQLQDSVKFYEQLHQFDYTDVYKKMKTLAEST